MLKMFQTGKTSLLFIVIAIAAITIGIFVQTSKVPQTNSGLPLPEFATTFILPKPKAIKNASFTDHRGQLFGLEQMAGKWSILFFGFTNCPDICPTTMQTLKQAKQKVSEAGLWNDYQVVMVSVDPERDSIEKLSKYVPYFDPEFIGLTGNVKSTAEFAKQLGILFVKRETPDNSSYEVDHSASLILINPNGDMAGVISAPHHVDEISSDLIKLAEYTQTTDDKYTKQSPPAAALEKVDARLSEPGSDNQREPLAALTIDNAWIRPAPPGASAMAAYMDIANNSDNDIRITTAKSSAFGEVMIHSTDINSDGVASMNHLDSLRIPANSRVALSPLATHIMLMQPKKPLSEGETTDITLITGDQTPYTFSVTVKQPLTP